MNYLENMTELDSRPDCYSLETVNMQTEKNVIYKMLEILIPQSRILLTLKDKEI